MERKAPLNYYPTKRLHDIEYLKKSLDIENEKELEEESEKRFDIVKYSEECNIKEKPINLSSVEIIHNFGWIDLGGNLFEQMKGNVKLSKKDFKRWANSLKTYVVQFYADGCYDEAIKESEKLLEVYPKGNLNYFYLLQKSYVKSLVKSDKDKEYKLDKIIVLEKKLKTNKKESELILNILENCKEDDELFSKMIRFVDDYYDSINKFTI